MLEKFAFTLTDFLVITSIIMSISFAIALIGWYIGQLLPAMRMYAPMVLAAIVSWMAMREFNGFEQAAPFVIPFLLSGATVTVIRFSRTLGAEKIKFVSLSSYTRFLPPVLPVLVVSWLLFTLSMVLPVYDVDFWSRENNPVNLYGWQVVLIILTIIIDVELPAIILSLCNVIMIATPCLYYCQKSGKGLHLFTGIVLLLLAVYAWLPMLYSFKYSQLLVGYYVWATSLVVAAIGFLLSVLKKQHE